MLNIFAINNLLCPYCGVKFEWGRNLLWQKETWGTLCCDCDEFPVVFGIVVLDKKKCKKMVALINNRDFLGSLEYALQLGRRSWLFRFYWKIREMGLKIEKTWLINKLIWRYPDAEWNYYLNRLQEKESQLFWLPLSVSGLKIKTWVDIGIGLESRYQELQDKVKGVNIIAVEKSFKNILVNKLINTVGSVTYICSDFGVNGNLVAEADVVTMIDSMTFIEDKKRVVEKVTSQMLSTNGVFVASSIAEHVYINDLENYFPISQKVFRKFFDIEPMIVDELKLLRTGLLKKSLLSTNQKPRFRFAVVWPRKKIEDIEFGIGKVWDDADIVWKNRVY